jgi:hypothetical protein
MTVRLRNPRLRYMADPITDGTTGVVLDPRAAENASRTFTQAEVTAFLAREKDQGERAGKAEILAGLTTRLGGRELADVIAAADAARTAEDAAKTETQRQLDAATAKGAEADKILATAKSELHQTRIRSALLAAGAPEAAIGSIAVNVEAGATPEVIAAAVATLKTAVPALFGAVAAPNSDPLKAPLVVAGTGTAAEKAAAVAKSRGYSTAA